MKARKAAVLSALLVLMLALSSAVSFGSYPVKSSKQTSTLTTSFSIGLINPGNRAATVQLSAEKSDDYNVTFSRNSFEIEPSEVTRNPSGSGWYSLSDGRYVRTEQVEVRVDISRFRSSNTVKIPVTVRAFNPGSSGFASSNMVYIREHVFNAEVTGMEPEEKESEEGSLLNWQPSGESSSEDSDEPVVEVENGSKNYKPARETTDKGGSGIDGTTWVLLLGVAAMSIYVYRVI